MLNEYEDERSFDQKNILLFKKSIVFSLVNSTTIFTITYHVANSIQFIEMIYELNWIRNMVDFLGF